MLGAPGAPTGVTLFEAAEAGPVPIAFVAVTVKVYAVPLVRPVTMIGEPGLVEVMHQLGCRTLAEIRDRVDPVKFN